MTLSKTPKYFIFCLLCSTSIVPSALSILIFYLGIFFLLGFSSHIKFVLEKLIDTLFTSHHIFTFLSSELTVFSRTFTSWAEAKTFVSSAHILNAKALEQFCKSFIYRLGIILDLGNLLVEFHTSLFV